MLALPRSKNKRMDEGLTLNMSVSYNNSSQWLLTYPHQLPVDIIQFLPIRLSFYLSSSVLSSPYVYLCVCPFVYSFCQYAFPYLFMYMAVGLMSEF